MAATFSIQFYNISVPPNTLDKGEPQEGTAVHTCTPLTWIDGLHATVTLDYASAVEGANYCKITTDDRTLYCYKRDFSLGTAGRMSVSLELDPLMTNKTGILACSGLLDTSTNKSDWNTMIVGDRMVYAYGITKGANASSETLNVDPRYFYIGVYG